MKKQIFLSSILLLSLTARAEDITENISQERVSKTISENIDSISENCNAIVLTFVINKDENCNKEAWQEIVKKTAELIEFTEETNNCQTQDSEDVIKKSHEFLSNCTAFTGNENKIYSGYRINLNIPESFAKTIFPDAKSN